MKTAQFTTRSRKLDTQMHSLPVLKREQFGQGMMSRRVKRRRFQRVPVQTLRLLHMPDGRPYPS